MCRLYIALLNEWVPEARWGGGLKTDLFEEALTPHSLIPHMGENALGMDCSVSVVQEAQRRLTVLGKECSLMVCDLRRLAIKSNAIRYVLSGSSLDHFCNEQEITTGFAELHRVLVPGGTAVITLDNPHNPVIWLRNHLPYPWLKALHLVPYFVGATITREETCRQLEAVGFQVEEVRCVAHAPRAPAIWLTALLERFDWESAKETMSRALDRCEKLQNWPTSFRTGYYIACRARKRTDGPPSGVHNPATSG
jgi:SAM-dependent methyltransferase